MQKYFIFDETMGNNFLLCEQCIQAERSEYTRFSMLERGNASSYGRAFPFSLHGFRGMRQSEAGTAMQQRRISRDVRHINIPCQFARQGILCEKSLVFLLEIFECCRQHQFDPVELVYFACARVEVDGYDI